MRAIRAAQWKMYPRDGAQGQALERLRRQCHALYNAAIQVVRENWSKSKRNVGYNALTKQLTELRNDDAEWFAFPYTVHMDTLKRVDLAFQAFFRRCRAGQAPGYPRWKGHDWFPGVGARSERGWKFEARDDGRAGWLTIKGVPGRIRCRGGSRSTILRVKQFSATRDRDGGWTLTTFSEVEVDRSTTPGLAVGIDINVANIAIADNAGRSELIPTPRPMREAREHVETIAREVSSKPLRSSARMRARRKLAKAKRREASIRRDWLHKLSDRIVRDYGIVATEKLAINNMTRSAKGTIEEPGKMVAQKAGLNRSILDVAPGMLLDMLRYKCEEAGAQFIEIDTRKHAPSQTCPACGRREKKSLAERTHRCPCGCEMHRDIAAATVILNVALEAVAKAEPPAALA